MTRDPKNDRWTCPNDRNLQLRSKLNTGWSVHTGKRSPKKDLQLTENELLEIQKVLQRSEMVERNERERVLKMVDRLENLKRHASQTTNGGVSPNRCGICGDFFCLIRTAPNQCASCQRILCNKCSIDTPFNYDDYANPSHGNTLHYSSAASTSHSRRSSSVSLSAAGPASGASAGGANGASNGRMFVYLCRLCSEQREFLKKSGVWFMRKYPSYLLNADKFNSTSNISQMERVPSSVSKTSFVSPTTGLKRNLSTSSSNSSSFRFWKNINAQYFQNDANAAADNVSDISNEAELAAAPPHTPEDNGTFDTDQPAPPPSAPGMTINTTTNHNHMASQSSTHFYAHKSSAPSGSPSNARKPSQALEQSTFSQSSNSTTTTTGTDRSSSISSPSPAASSHSQQQLASSSSSTKKKAPTPLKNKSYNDFSDDDDDDSLSDAPTSPNMTNYNYYSNIITNLNPTSMSLNLISGYGGEAASATGNDAQSLGINSLTSATLTSISTTANSPTVRSKTVEAAINGTNWTSPSVEQQAAPNKSNKENQIGKPMSLSVSDLDSDQVVAASVAAASGSHPWNPKKSKGLEWCSTQLSMEESNLERNMDNMNRRHARHAKEMLCQSDSQSAITSRASRSTTPKISSQTVNNLAKKILSQNSSATTSHIAASSSSAISSASSLATSLTKLNFK